MSYLISIKVPTYSYLKKFILKRALSSDGSITITNNRSDSIVLWKILSKAPYRVEKNLLLTYDTEIQIWISEFLSIYSGFELNKMNTFIFNQYLKKQFDESMCHFIQINLIEGYHNNIEDLILSFTGFYDITEDEKSLDSCIKSYQRWRQSFKSLNIT